MSRSAERGVGLQSPLECIRVEHRYRIIEFSDTQKEIFFIRLLLWKLNLFDDSMHVFIHWLWFKNIERINEFWIFDNFNQTSDSNAQWMESFWIQLTIHMYWSRSDNLAEIDNKSLESRLWIAVMADTGYTHPTN